MRRAKNKGDGIDRYWRSGGALLVFVAVVQFIFSLLTVGVPYLSPILTFGAMSSAFAASLIISLNKRVEKLEDALNELTEDTRSCVMPAPSTSQAE